MLNESENEACQRLEENFGKFVKRLESENPDLVIKFTVHVLKKGDESKLLCDIVSKKNLEEFTVSERATVNAYNSVEKFFNATYREAVPDSILARINDFKFKSMTCSDFLNIVDNFGYDLFVKTLKKHTSISGPGVKIVTKTLKKYGYL